MSGRGAHRVIRASAGTGKTYQLSGRYVALLLSGAEPASILASTFTRKAAGEIQGRVLARLATAATDPAQLEELGRQIGDEVEGAITAERCLDALERLVRELHRARIGTLDSFLVGLGRTFALDLGLPPDWTIVEEAVDRRLRAEAAATALTEAGDLERVELLRALNRGDVARAVESTLLGAVAAGRDAYLESEAEAWACVRPRREASEEDEGRVRELLERLPLACKKDGEPYANWVKARAKVLELLARRDWRAILENTLVEKVRACESKYSGGDISDECNDTICELLELCAAHLLAEVAARNLATRAWLGRFEDAYQRVKAREGAYRFEDLPALLAPREGDPLAARGIDLAFRLDGRIDHLLLDEFQDTSTSQWRALDRVTEEILSESGRSFFCVGDAKQSIYGWRQAEPRLFETLADVYPVLVPEELHESWRSSPVVLKTVNLVFGAIGANAAWSSKEEQRAAAQAFQEGFVPHVAAPGRDGLPGAASLLRAPAPAEGEAKGLPALRRAAERVAEILDEAPEATVGVLVRKNAPVNHLIVLLRERGIAASGEGGTPLTDSAAVLAALSLVHLADHPCDLAAAFHAASTPLGEAFGLAPGSWRDRRIPAAREVRRRLAEEGYGRFLASLLPLVRAGYDDWDARRFEQLVELGHQHDARAGLRPDDFVLLAHQKPVEDPTSARVRVMTVHRAKGLEFDAVVLPQLDEYLSGRRDLLLERPDPHAPIARASVDPGEAVCALDPVALGPMRAHAVEREVRESLCLLYVAMTRARHRLDMIVGDGTQGDGEKVPKLGRLLVAALGADGEEDGVIWRHPESAERWLPPRAPAGDEPGEAEDEPPAELGLASRPDSPRRARATASGRTGGGSVRAADCLGTSRRPGGGGLARGSLVHHYLESCEWADDLAALPDEELVPGAAAVEPDVELRREALDWLRARLELPGVRACLERPSDAEELEVWRERRFAVILPAEDGTEELWSGAFDRVVLRRDPAGGYASAEIVDYKTDAVAPDAIPDLLAHYRPQLDAYRRILCAMTGLPQDAVATKLLLLDPGELVDL